MLPAQLAGGDMARYGFWRGLRGIVSGTGQGVVLGCIPVIWFDIWGLIKTAPRVADPATGAIYTYNNHGGLIHLTAAQWVEAHMILGVVALMFLMVWISPKKNYQRLTLGSGIMSQSEPSLVDGPRKTGPNKADKGSVFWGARWDVDDPHGLHLCAMIVMTVVTLVALYFFRAEVLGTLADLWFGLTAS